MVTAEAVALAMEDRASWTSWELAQHLNGEFSLSDELERVLEARPDLFVVASVSWHRRWTLVGSDRDPMNLVIHLAKVQAATVADLADVLQWNKAVVLDTLRGFRDVFESHSYGPPVWSLRVSSREAESAIRAAAARRPEVQPSRSGTATTYEPPPRDEEIAQLLTKLHEARSHLLATAARLGVVATAEYDPVPNINRMGMPTIRRHIAKQIARLDAQTRRLDEAARLPRNRALPSPRSRPISYPEVGSYGRSRCGHVGRCGCG